jgi:RecA-family ATPase
VNENRLVFTAQNLNTASRFALTEARAACTGKPKSLVSLRVFKAQSKRRFGSILQMAAQPQTRTSNTPKNGVFSFARDT